MMNTMNSMMTDRMSGMMPGAMNPMMNMPMMGGMSSMMGGMMSPMMMNSMMMAPRCTIKMERMTGGMKMTCMCDDKTSAEMMKNLCMMMQGGMMSCCMMMNGMMCCCCNMGMMGMCKMEMTEMGCVMTCTSGDSNCMKMIQSCCDCMMAMMMPGNTCCMMMNGMPIGCMVM
jgi:hypothetical protein